MRQRITISGYYGFRNAGDEAVLAGLVKALRTQEGGRDLFIDVLSIDPDETRASHGLPASHRYKTGPLLRSIARADLLISGGGSLLQDVTSAHGIFYYAAVVRIAQILGKKTMFAAQGIGPLIRPRSRRLVAGIANRLNAITVRDPESLALLKEIGVRRPPMEVTADPALLLAEPRPKATARPRVTISLRPWASANDDLIARLAGTCHALGSIDVATLAMQPQADDAPLESFRAGWGKIADRPAIVAAADEKDRLSAIVQALTDSDLVIAMRLHALILAAGAGVPSVALAYDPKVTSFMKCAGQEDAALSLESADKIAHVIHQTYHDRRSRAEALRSLLPTLRAAALRNGEVAMSLLR